MVRFCFPMTLSCAFDVQTEFHRALRDHRPFAAVVSWTNDGVLTGEALPESKLWLESARTNEISLEGHSWKVRLPANTDWKSARLRVKRDGKEIVISLA